ncbi:hypothetical protein TWF481_010213 [Arthrobotrys musiformis]|uniref:Uncharacterized protein n=1 Tax=Arthrobotrys musiformis TaxID=47236 RepID=A0AAV9W064_9PEZI
MQIKSIIAVAVVGLTPLVSATAFTCPTGKTFYCCTNSGPLGGTCIAYDPNYGCPSGAPNYPSCCYSGSVDCTWATAKPSGVYTCLCP